MKHMKVMKRKWERGGILKKIHDIFFGERSGMRFFGSLTFITFIKSLNSMFLAVSDGDNRHHYHNFMNLMNFNEVKVLNGFLKIAPIVAMD